MSAIAFKLGTLLVRQVTRPMANALKRQAKEHDTFKEFCISLAQRVHVYDVVLRSKITPSKYSRPIRPLNDVKAVENGATLLSEIFVFGVTGSVVVWETLRQCQKELDRREQVTQDIQFLQSEIEELSETLRKQGNDIQSLKKAKEDADAKQTNLKPANSFRFRWI